MLLVFSLWFSASAVAPDLREAWGLDDAQAAGLTAAVQIGFVAGTLAFAVLNLPDRIPAHLLFLASALTGAAANALLLLAPGGISGIQALRFLTGVAMAGIYPVGMKILASWEARPGLALGILIAALGLGNGAPYLVRSLGVTWPIVLAVASALAVAGGLLVAFGVRAGPRLPARSPFDPRAFARAFRVPAFRRSALGYFGHMWELYALWGLLALFLAARGTDAATASALVFLVFLGGSAGSVLGGLLSRRVGEARVAFASLVASGLFCLASPLLFEASVGLLAALLFVWGAVAAADSAQFSALSASASPRAYVGTALTLQNAVGFAVTFVSLAVIPRVASLVGWQWAFVALAPGAALGALAIWGSARAPQDGSTGDAAVFTSEPS